MGVKGVFREHTTSNISYGEGPDVNDMIWIDNSTGIIYNYDSERASWLSSSRHTFEFARKGSAKGMYIPLLGDLDDIEDVYVAGKSAAIVSVFCRSRAGDKNMGFEIRKNGVSIYDFYYDGTSRLYSNDSLNFNLTLDDQIQVYVKLMGTGVLNTVCRIETAWRYDL